MKKLRLIRFLLFAFILGIIGVSGVTAYIYTQHQAYFQILDGTSFNIQEESGRYVVFSVSEGNFSGYAEVSDRLLHIITDSSGVLVASSPYEFSLFCNNAPVSSKTVTYGAGNDLTLSWNFNSAAETAPLFDYGIIIQVAVWVVVVLGFVVLGLVVEYAKINKDK